MTGWTMFVISAPPLVCAVAKSAEPPPLLPTRIAHVGCPDQPTFGTIAAAGPLDHSIFETNLVEYRRLRPAERLAIVAAGAAMRNLRERANANALQARCPGDFVVRADANSGFE